MKTSSLNYNLPSELIAQKPAHLRTLSRLLVMDRSKNTLHDRNFPDIIEYLDPGDCLVLNDTKVIPARFFARKTTGAKLEGLFIAAHESGTWQVMLKNARKIKKEDHLIITDRQGNDFCRARAIDRTPTGQWLIEPESNDTPEQILEKIGFAPLPPYIKRSPDKQTDQSDLTRYQTVYARQTGAIAAPTAGLHFTDQLLEKIKQKGAQLAYVTLHVGAGTFKPVTADNLADHDIHSETYSLDEKNARIINDAIAKNKRIIAVGTTTVRTLETIAKQRNLTPQTGDTKLFISPPYDFKVVDAIITNFHLPKSTLLALIAAFAGLEEVQNAYKHAIQKKYRFYSYGDAMLII
ncbi:MAG: tRNA preQ1(34) S-adenosylmethionine ribosyltransferase-isomerase QueA [Planctomycetes bacterium]|nr:tRNA preQ1(34) S-adenosylmethionine ribosyltransferase-isomerase QueA [Planctomycetota bacterium]